MRNVAELVDPPASIRKKHHAPKIDDLQRLPDATREDRLHAMILVALGRGEVLGLKWGDIDLEGRTLTVRRHVVRTKQTGRAVLEGAKTDAGERTVMLPQILVRRLQRHRDHLRQDQALAGARWVGPDYLGGVTDGFVFTSTVGTGIEPRRVNVYFSEACERAGIPAHTFHGLRHDFGSLLLAAGADSGGAGDARARQPYITMGRYQHVPDELQRDAADRLDVVLNFAS